MCEKEELLKKIDELKQQVEALDSEYPKYMLSYNKPKSNQYIVKFTSKCEGEVVAVSDDPLHSFGHISNAWTEHADISTWKEVTNPDELCDKDLVECWDDDDTHGRLYRFYDTENECSFDLDGTKNGVYYDNYRKLMPWEYPDWAIEAQKTLED